MTDHTVKSFGEQLDALSALVAQMGGLAEAQFAAAIEAISRRDSTAAERAVGGDARIDEIQQEIEERALGLNREPPIRLTQSLARMGKAAQNQLKQVLDAFSSRNAEEAETVWNRDGEIDEIYNSLFRELLTYMMEDPRTIGLCTHLLFVAKNIERSGDHATNIAEVVYHMVRAGHLANNRPKADTTSETAVPFEAQH